MVDGTMTIRMRVASMKMAAAKPMPNSLMMMLSPSTNDRKNVHMMAAAAVMTRAVAESPSATAWPLSPVFRYSSRMRESRKTS